MITSGTTVITTGEIVTKNGAHIMPGCQAMVLGMARDRMPAIYLCETMDDEFATEEFFCFEDNIVPVQEVA